MNNIDSREIEKFDDLAEIWWNPNGEMGTLLTINPLRTKYILDRLESPNCKILDIGCGGGVLTESLAQSGAQMTGIDMSGLSIEVAKRHAQSNGLKIEYHVESAESFAEKHAGDFDVITCMEMLEHIPDPAQTVAACAKLLKPGGHAFFSTINRTPKAFLFAIIGGEYILRLLPKGSHQYNKLIRPDELKKWGSACQLKNMNISSLIYNPFKGSFKVREVEDVNYFAHFIKNNDY